jgi:hypothetical protein
VEVLRNEKAAGQGGAAGGASNEAERSAAAGLKRAAGFKSMAGLALAVAADALELAFPPAWLLIDAVATAGFFLIWGLRWEIAVVLLPELIPGMNVFPSWTLLAMFLSKKDAEN